MTNYHKNVGVARHLEQLTEKKEKIVSETFALGFLHLLNCYLSKDDSVTFKQEVSIDNHWLEITLPISFNVNGQLYRLKLPFKVFVLEGSTGIQLILIEQFITSKFGIDFDLEIIDFKNGFKLVYLDNEPSLALIFEKTHDYQQTMESLVMACYEILFEDRTDTPSQSMLS